MHHEFSGDSPGGSQTPPTVTGKATPEISHDRAVPDVSVVSSRVALGCQLWENLSRHILLPPSLII